MPQQCARSVEFEQGIVVRIVLLTGHQPAEVAIIEAVKGEHAFRHRDVQFVEVGAEVGVLKQAAEAVE